MTAELVDSSSLKQQIREQAHANRNAQENKDEISREIVARCMSLPEYQRAATVLFYLDVRSEVRTRNDLDKALASGKKIIVPYCVDGELELFHLTDPDELSVGMYRILEPKPELRTVAAKRVDVAEIDLIIVPGVAFDREGGRTGHGKGYYDKLLEHARPDTPLVALAFECQLFDKIPMQDHDVFMDKVVTEKAVYNGRGRCASGSDGDLDAWNSDGAWALEAWGRGDFDDVTDDYVAVYLKKVVGSGNDSRLLQEQIGQERNVPPHRIVVWQVSSKE